MPVPVFAHEFSLLSQVTVSNVSQAIFIVTFTLVISKLVHRGLEGLGEAATRSRFFFKLLIPLVNFTLWLIAAGWIASIFAPSPQAVVALTASVGIAIGLGAQDLVKNLIGGLIILTDRPYQMGDRVRIGEATGEIDHIGLRSTKMTNLDDTRITIPNSEILTGMIWNSNSGVPDEQVYVDLYLRCSADPYDVLRIGYEAAYSSPYLLLSKPVVCLLSDYVDQSSFLRLRIKGYVYDHRAETRFQTDVTARAKAAFGERGMLPERD
jgi:small-conductance mechanosensitive channel